MTRTLERAGTKSRRACPICKHKKGTVRWWKWRRHQEMHLAKGETL